MGWPPRTSWWVCWSRDWSADETCPDGTWRHQSLRHLMEGRSHVLILPKAVFFNSFEPMDHKNFRMHLIHSSVTLVFCRSASQLLTAFIDNMLVAKLDKAQGNLAKICCSNSFTHNSFLSMKSCGPSWKVPCVLKAVRGKGNPSWKTLA